MASFLLNRKNLLKCLCFGSIAAATYILMVIMLLLNRTYQHIYYLFIGNFSFMIIAGAYTLSSAKSTESNKLISTITTGLVIVLAGTLITALFNCLAVLYLYPNIFGIHPNGSILDGMPATVQFQRPSGLLLLLNFNALIGNSSTAALAVLLMAYATKQS